MPFDLFPENRKDKRERNKHIHNLFNSGLLSFKTICNNLNGDYNNDLNTIANIFQQQLPKMPKDYIIRQVFDPKHKNLVLMSDKKVIGGICYRPFYDKYFIEIVFCAIQGDAQIKGYGGFMMSFLKEAIKTEAYFYLKEQKEMNQKCNKMQKYMEGKQVEKIDNDRKAKGNKSKDNHNILAIDRTVDNHIILEDNRTADHYNILANDRNVDNHNILEYDRTVNEKADGLSFANNDKNALNDLVKNGVDHVNNFTFATEKACKILGLDVKTYTVKSTNYLTQMYKKMKIPIYIMTYADNYAIGYFKKNGFKTDITFKNWVGCIKDYDGGTMMQSKVIWEVNYLKKEEFLEEYKAKLILAMSKISEFNIERRLCAKIDDENKKSDNVMDDDYASTLMKKIYKSPYDIPGVREAKLTDEMLIKKSQNERLVNILNFFLNDLQSHSSAWPFLQPVKKNEVPDYYNVITNPMDLSKMECKLKENMYKGITDFVNDVKLIVKNCYTYNAPSTQYYKCAQKIEEYFEKKISNYNF